MVIRVQGITFKKKLQVS